jgi:hypothetical protein
MTKTQKQKALFPLRFAVKGWAFTSETMLRGKLTHCEQVASALPAELAADATEILRPLRDAVPLVGHTT